MLLRGVQEALTNVRRHGRLGGGATTGGQVSVHVDDDGVGFDPSVVSVSGLEELRGRVADMGGEVDVLLAPGSGTRVTVRMRGP